MASSLCRSWVLVACIAGVINVDAMIGFAADLYACPGTHASSIHARRTVPGWMEQRDWDFEKPVKYGGARP